MSKPVVFMFSGQGSQYFQMGKDLYLHNERFKLWMNYCDEIVTSFTKVSLIDVLYKNKLGKQPVFDRLLYTNPALICVEYSLSKILIESGVKPDYLLGYSLGEITAAIVSGSISLEQGLRFSIEYADLIEKKTKISGMLVVLETIDFFYNNPEIFSNCWLAGKNFKNNFVISGLHDDVEKINEKLNALNVINQKLPVNYGFHTELIDPIKDNFSKMINDLDISIPSIPVFSSFSAKKLDEITGDYLWTVMRQSVDFEKNIHLMLEENNYFFIDAGPSGSLATFVKYLLPEKTFSKYASVMTPFGDDIKALGEAKKVYNSWLLAG